MKNDLKRKSEEETSETIVSLFQELNQIKAEMQSIQLVEDQRDSQAQEGSAVQATKELKTPETLNPQAIGATLYGKEVFSGVSSIEKKPGRQSERQSERKTERKTEGNSQRLTATRPLKKTSGRQKFLWSAAITAVVGFALGAKLGLILYYDSPANLPQITVLEVLTKILF